ncbi:MAG: glycosyltransferase family 2 protein [Chitinophagaceae bacterium]|nr:glycosyltransferase family 2 protein [Chitinophagaceae bacterium]
MSKGTPLVTVAMATYNGEKYIRTQLNSILDQTYRSIEIVITDDASADNTVSIIKEYQTDHPFIKLHINQENSGVTKTFENSIRAASGDFIAIADQDDIWELNKIETLLNELQQEDAVYSNSLLVDREGKSLGKDFKSIMHLRSYYEGSPFMMGNCVPGHTILMKAAFAKKILPIPAEIMFDRWISFCAAGSNGIRYVDKTLVHYRQHESNTIGAGKSKNKKKRKTKREKFDIKLAELTVMNQAPITNPVTKELLGQMLQLFTHKLSFKRSAFFFKHLDTILVIKNKPRYRKILYALKMFFKANY